MKSGSAPKGAPEAGAAKPQTRTHLIPTDRLAVQLLLVDDANATECIATNSVDIDIAIPNHPLEPAEADLRFYVNTRRREPEGWWRRAVANGQPCCPRCYREEWAEEWSA